MESILSGSIEISLLCRRRSKGEKSSPPHWKPRRPALSHRQQSLSVNTTATSLHNRVGRIPKRRDRYGSAYLKEKDRDHMYIPRHGCTWMPAIPLIGRRVDTIHHCLGELARMNKEIRAELAELAELESSGKESSKYPRMKNRPLYDSTPNPPRTWPVKLF